MSRILKAVILFGLSFFAGMFIWHLSSFLELYLQQGQILVVVFGLSLGALFPKFFWLVPFGTLTGMIVSGIMNETEPIMSLSQIRYDLFHRIVAAPPIFAIILISAMAGAAVRMGIQLFRRKSDN